MEVQFSLTRVGELTNVCLWLPSPRTKKDRQIVAFSLSPEMARAVKSEAARRGLPLRALFEELWQLYQQKAAKGKT